MTYTARTSTLRKASVSAAAALLFTLIAGVAAPAQAASTKWVYLIFPSWLGNCPSSSVYGVQAAVGNTWSTNWDVGDDIVYGRVLVGANQTVSYNLACRKYGRPVGYQAGSATIRPTSSTTNVFIGPAGIRYS